MMITFKEGDLVGVPCSIQLGAFPDESLVLVETDDGPISGFVKQPNLETAADGERGYVKGAVLEALSDSIMVRLFGLFFTTALGVAPINRNNLMRLGAQ